MSSSAPFFQRQKLATACILFAVATAIVTIAFIILTAEAISNNTSGVAAFNAITNNFTTKIESVFNASLLELQVVGGLFTVLAQINNQVFAEFLDVVPLVNNNATIFWAKVVPDAEVAQHEAMIRSEVNDDCLCFLLFQYCLGVSKLHDSQYQQQ
jgi:hypothetical protein